MTQRMRAHADMAAQPATHEHENSASSSAQPLVAGSPK